MGHRPAAAGTEGKSSALPKASGSCADPPRPFRGLRSFRFLLVSLEFFPADVDDEPEAQDVVSREPGWISGSPKDIEIDAMHAMHVQDDPPDAPFDCSF